MEERPSDWSRSPRRTLRFLAWHVPYCGGVLAFTLVFAEPRMDAEARWIAWVAASVAGTLLVAGVALALARMRR